MHFDISQMLMSEEITAHYNVKETIPKAYVTFVHCAKQIFKRKLYHTNRTFVCKSFYSSCFLIAPL